MKSFQGFAASACAAMIAVAIFAGTATASPTSRALIREGAEAMRAGDAPLAAARFRAAIKADPRDSDAMFYMAVLANRTGDPRAALDFAQRAHAMGNDRADLDFELGWAEVNAGLPAAAVVALGRYEAAHPGRGLTSELLGRAYLALGEADRSRTAFREAMRRDPKLRANALYYLGRLEAAQGNQAAAARP